MPHRFPRGKGLVVDSFVQTCEGIISRGLQLAFGGWSGKSKSAAACIRQAAAGAVEVLENRTLLSSTYFVATNGSDSNPGSVSAPFKTIQHAANIARAGDVVDIRGGTYHETVHPVNSGTSSAPITFQAYNGESVTVSGADPITGWSSYGNSIYDASMPWSLGTGNDQVFVDGQMINYARWPNTSLDPSHPNLAHAQSVRLSGSTATLYDSSLTQSSGYWDGATIHIAPGEAWIAQTGTVTNSGNGWLTFNYQPLDSYELPKAGNAYYLTGTFKALDSAGEWYNSGGKLYVRTPSSDNPAYHDVEAKHRLYAFDLSGNSYITVQNLNIFASTINTSSSSSHDVINHIGAYYTGQFLMNVNGWSEPTNLGIVLAGSYDVLENSTVAYSAGDGVYVTGYGSVVSNNTVRDTDYSASDAAAIRVKTSGVTISHNTIYNAGRDGIQHQGSGLSITNNSISAIGIQTTEAGGIYDVNTNGGGTTIAYNTIYSFHSGGYGSTGIFLDNNSSSYNIHNNAVSNVDSALKMNYTCRYNSIYSNTLSGSQFAINTNQKGDWYGTSIHNNAVSGQVVLTSGGSYYSNSSSGGAGSISSGSSSTASAPPAQSQPVSSGGTGSISGTFFLDSNANGVWNYGEPASPYWGVYIDANNDGRYDSGDREIIAGSNGAFTFSGLAAGKYVIRGTTASGWTQTSPANGGAYVITLASGQNVTGQNIGEYHGTIAGSTSTSAKGSISGTFFYDSNANGVWNYGEPASPSWGVYIDANNDGRYDSGDKEIIAGSNGAYSFTGLAAGTYVIRGTTASGWTQTSPANGAAQVVTLAAGQNVTGENFGEVKGTVAGSTSTTAKGSISGTFFYDSNANGVWNYGEQASPSWGVYIDMNNDGRYDYGDKEIIAGSNGAFTFSGLAAGTYVIRGTTASGWTQTSPANGGAQVITLSAGQNVTGANIGEYHGTVTTSTATGSITGTFFYDTNANGVWNSGEVSSPSWGVYIDANNDGRYDAGDTEIIANKYGTYAFSGLKAGTYVIRATTASGWKQTNGSGKVITLSAGQNVTGVNFGEVRI